MMSVVLAMAMQAAGTTAIAIDPDDPQTWVLEYPLVIEEDIAEYTGCLRSQMLTAPGDKLPEFEAQHRLHIPLCSKQRAKAIGRANSTLDRLGNYSEFTPDWVERTFQTIEVIHIERGRDIDNRLSLHVSEHARYNAAYQQSPDEVSRGEPIVAKSSEEESQESTDAEN